MDVVEILEDLGKCTGGIVVYEAAKAAANAANSVPGDYRSKHKLRPEIKHEMCALFPDLDLDRLRIRINCTLPGEWYPSEANVDAMTFGYTIYFKNSGYMTQGDDKRRLLIHELVHVEQVRRLGGETAFACEYGKGYVNAGMSYRANPFEVEAYRIDRLAYRDSEGLWRMPASSAPRIHYRASDGHVHELYSIPGQPWQHADLSAIASAPDATGDPHGYYAPTT